MREPNGEAQSIVAVIVDITARKEVEQALQRSNEALEQLVDQRTNALSVANAELKGEIDDGRDWKEKSSQCHDREQQRLGQNCTMAFANISPQWRSWPALSRCG